jgi:ABC-2 type transport system permease protein
MRQILALALKDLRLMPRNRGGMFFTFVWPVLVTVLFGIMFGGDNNGDQGRIRIAIVDNDKTDGSRAFLEKLEESFELTPMTVADAENAVRKGQRTGYIVVKPGFGEASNRMFYGSPKEIEVGVDPARQAEAGMLEGLLMKHAAADMQKMFTDSTASTAIVEKALDDMKDQPADQVAPVQRFLGELKAFMGAPQSQGPPGAAQREWQPLKITKKDVARVSEGPRNPFDITFPQGVIWGLIGRLITAHWCGCAWRRSPTCRFSPARRSRASSRSCLSS